MGYAVRMSLSPCTLTLPVLLGLAVGLNSSAGWGMLAGVVACPSLMFGTLPDDAVIEAAVDMVLKSADMAVVPR